MKIVTVSRHPEGAAGEMLPNEVFATDRLSVRRVNSGIADSLFLVQLLNDPAWLRFIGDRNVRSIDDAQRYVAERLLSSYERLGYGHYLVQSRTTRCPLGICGLARRDYLDAPDIGYAFLPEHRGRGYAWEAASALLAHAIHQLQMKRILATTRTENHASRALLLKLGFRFERMFRHPDGDRDLEIYAYTTPQERVQSL